MRSAIPFIVAFAFIGCGSEPQPAPTFTAEPLSLEPVAWASTPWPTPISFVHETENGIALCTSDSLVLVAGGVVANRAADAKGCESGARVPASEGAGDWDIMIASGAIFRLANDGSTESVSARYGLEAKKVTRVVSIDASQFAFQYDGGFAIVDKGEVKLFAQANLSSLASGDGKFGYLTSDAAHVLDTKTGGVTAFAVTGAKGMAFDTSKRLVVTTGSTIYREANGALVPLVDNQSALSSPASAGGKVWIMAGSELILLEDDHILKTSGLSLNEGAVIFGSSSGDVWLSRPSGVARLRHGSAGNALEQKWQADVAPIYAKVCSACHGPTGSAKIDLSSYNSWVSRKAALNERVVVKADMPPAGVTLSADDRAKLSAFIGAMP